MIKSCPSHSPHSGRPCGSQAPLPVPGGGWCPHRWADSRGDSPPATMAKSMEMGLSLFTRAPLCLPLLRPCLLPCLHPSSCFSHPSLQTHRHRLQSGRQLTLDLLGHWSLQFSVEDGKKPHSVSTPASTILSLKQIPKGNYPEPRGAD